MSRLSVAIATTWTTVYSKVMITAPGCIKGAPPPKLQMIEIFTFYLQRGSKMLQALLLFAKRINEYLVIKT